MTSVRPTSGILSTIAAVLFVLGGASHAKEAVGIYAMPSGKYRLDRDHAHVYWAVSHVGFSMTRGRFNSFDGEVEFDPSNLADSRAEIVIKAESIDVNNSALEEELRGENFFNAREFPEIRFVFASAELTDANNGKILGDLTMKGVTKPVTIDFKLNKVLANPKNPAFTRMGFSGRGMIDRREWGVDAVDIVGADVELLIDAEFLLDVADGSNK